MTSVMQEIENAIMKLNFSVEEISSLAPEDNQILYQELLSTFVENGNRRWWWEDFKNSFTFKTFENPFEQLNTIIPDLNSHVWLMLEDTEQDFYPIYEVKPTLIKDIIGNCFGFEYYIISKDKSWLICENHHNQLIGIGEQLRKHNLNNLSTL